VNTARNFQIPHKRNILNSERLIASETLYSVELITATAAIIIIIIIPGMHYVNR
jgi:hypothetical protein